MSKFDLLNNDIKKVTIEIPSDKPDVNFNFDITKSRVIFALQEAGSQQTKTLKADEAKRVIKYLMKDKYKPFLECIERLGKKDDEDDIIYELMETVVENFEALGIVTGVDTGK